MSRIPFYLKGGSPQQRSSNFFELQTSGFGGRLGAKVCGNLRSDRDQILYPKVIHTI